MCSPCGIPVGGVSVQCSWRCWSVTHLSLDRVRTVMKNLEKSWNFKTAFSRPGKVLEK